VRRRAAAPSRAELAAHTLATLKPAAGLSAAVLLVETPGGPAVVKDWAGGGRLGRLLGPRLARREARVYAALADHPAVPRYLGRVDRHAFAVEHRPGRRISRRHRQFSPAFAAALERAVRALHARGVAHLDLRHRSNVRADPQGRPVLVDFGASLRFRPGGWGARWLLPWAARIDLRALTKWRRLLAGR
jgi:hypothetical protein